jgi:translation elongation factor EF-1beta
LFFSFGAAQARLAKKEAAQRMMVVMEVKPWEAEQDLNKLWKKITTEVALEGLKWGEGCNLVDVAFGIKKIVMSCVVNMTVSTDDVVEQMQETYEEEVQSIDVISMNVL